MSTNARFFFKSIASLLLLAQCSLALAQASTPPSNICASKGYTVGFFNGVWNTPQAANDGSDILRHLGSNPGTYRNEPVYHEVFYNHTGSTVGASPLQDLAETFEQRAAEIDHSGELAKRWEFFWEILSGQDSLAGRLIGLFPSAVSLFSQLATSLHAKLVAIAASLLSNPPTEADYATHNARLDGLFSRRQKLIFAAHSQGNLFANHAFDYISPKLGGGSVKVVHIAPASPTLRGDYILANIDLIINALSFQGLSTVMASNISLKPSTKDLSGHTLAGTYLDPDRQARAKIVSLLDAAFSSVKSSSTPAEPDSWEAVWNGKTMARGGSAIGAADDFFRMYMEIENTTDPVCINSIDHNSWYTHYCPVRYVEFPTVDTSYKIYTIVDRLDRYVTSFQVNALCPAGYYKV